MLKRAERAELVRKLCPTAYDFQVEAVAKLMIQPSRLLGDDMGLGKTYEAVVLDMVLRRTEKRTGMTLVVCPKGAVMQSWQRHFNMLMPEASVTIIDPKNRSTFEAALAKGADGIYICHWDALRLMPVLGKVKFLHVIADEAHRAKNRKAQQTRALKKIQTQYKTACTGTPAADKPHDLWSLLNWLWPKYYRSYWNFRKKYCEEEVVYAQGQATGYTQVVGVKNEDTLQAEIKPFYIRRMKTEVLKDLPDKYYTPLWVSLEGKQRRAYDEMAKQMVAWVEDHRGEMSPLIAQEAIVKMTRLQQFAISYCSHEGTKIVRKRDAKTGELVEREVDVIRMVEPSAKLDVVMQLLEDNPDEQFVIFSQFKQAINMLGVRLEKEGIRHGLYTGDTKDADRASLVKYFQAGKIPVFAGTIAAGGEGIDLFSASKVIFIDRAWSPKGNKQAEDRLWRNGQKNAVQVIDIMARDTVDLGRHQRIEQKWAFIQKLLGDPAEAQRELLQ